MLTAALLIVLRAFSGTGWLLHEIFGVNLQIMADPAQRRLQKDILGLINPLDKVTSPKYSFR